MNSPFSVEQARIIADVVAARRAAKLQNASAAKQRAAKRRANLEGDIVKQEKALANLTAKLDRERQQLEQLDDEPGTVVGVSLSTSLRSPPIAASFPAGVPVTIAVKPAGRGFERLRRGWDQLKLLSRVGWEDASQADRERFAVECLRLSQQLAAAPANSSAEE